MFHNYCCYYEIESLSRKEHVVIGESRYLPRNTTTNQKPPKNKIELNLTKWNGYQEFEYSSESRQTVSKYSKNISYFQIYLLILIFVF